MQKDATWYIIISTNKIFHFIAGSDDPCITDAEMFGKAAEMMVKAGYRKVTSHLYEGMRHEILNETEKDKVWNDVLRFIEENN